MQESDLWNKQNIYLKLIFSGFLYAFYLLGIILCSQVIKLAGVRAIPDSGEFCWQQKDE